MKKSTRVYLIRHGQVVGHDEFRYNGHHDVDITETGVAQLEKMAEFLSQKPLSAVYSSDLVRSERGARIISGRMNMAHTPLKELRELHLGRWEGLTRQEASERYPEDANFSFLDLARGKITGGEDLKELRARVMPAFEGIVSRHAGDEVAIVAHGGVNRIILCEVMGMDFKNIFRIEQDYGCLNVIDVFDDGMKMVKLLNGGPNQEIKPPLIY